jgi:hypothetical protein
MWKLTQRSLSMQALYFLIWLKNDDGIRKLTAKID